LIILWAVFIRNRPSSNRDILNCPRRNPNSDVHWTKTSVNRNTGFS
jgi:hypothetical protein